MESYLSYQKLRFCSYIGRTDAHKRLWRKTVTIGNFDNYSNNIKYLNESFLLKLGSQSYQGCYLEERPNVDEEFVGNKNYHLIC